MSCKYINLRYSFRRLCSIHLSGPGRVEVVELCRATASASYSLLAEYIEAIPVCYPGMRDPGT